jgi:glutaredoxin 3
MAIKKHEIKVYTTTTCPYCHMAKDYFKKHKVKFTEVDVGEDKKAAEEMVEKSGQMGVPVIDIDGKIIVGFDKNAIEKALK